MSVGSGWISQMDVGMIETTNYLDNHQYRQNDTSDRPLLADHFLPTLTWIVALVFSLAFHVWLVNKNEALQMAKVIPELSSSQSISIQFSTLKPEQPVVETKPKPENPIIVSDPIYPVKTNKLAPTTEKKEQSKLIKTNDSVIAIEKKKSPVLDKIRDVETPIPIKEEVTKATEPTTTQINNDKPVEIASTKKTKQSNKVKKTEAISETLETYESSPLIKNPKFLKPPAKPKYPRLARRKKQQGTSIIRAKISKLGTVDEVRLHQTSGYRLLDKSAMKALRRWQFQPATQAGVTVTAWVQVPVKFQLEN